MRHRASLLVHDWTIKERSTYTESGDSLLILIDRLILQRSVIDERFFTGPSQMNMPLSAFLHSSLSLIQSHPCRFAFYPVVQTRLDGLSVSESVMRRSTRVPISIWPVDRDPKSQLTRPKGPAALPEYEVVRRVVLSFPSRIMHTARSSYRYVFARHIGMSYGRPRSSRPFMVSLSPSRIN